MSKAKIASWKHRYYQTVAKKQKLINRHIQPLDEKIETLWEELNDILNKQELKK